MLRAVTKYRVPRCNGGVAFQGRERIRPSPPWEFAILHACPLSKPCVGITQGGLQCSSEIDQFGAHVGPDVVVFSVVAIARPGEVLRWSAVCSSRCMHLRRAYFEFGHSFTLHQ